MIKLFLCSQTLNMQDSPSIQEQFNHNIFTVELIFHSLFQLISFSLLFLHNLIVSYMSSDPWYIEVGESIVKSLNTYTKVEGGFASIKDVTTMQLEDHQHSFFLAET